MKNNILCCDWGTTSFRLRLVDQHKFKVLAEVQTAEGVAGTFRAWQEQNETDRFDFYSQKLQALIEDLAAKYGQDLKNVPIIVSGMASSSLGMEEIPYAHLPFATNGSLASVKVYENFNGSGSPLVLVSGVRSQEDVMRGEEAQLIGLFDLPETSIASASDAIFVFPGTHSKHIFVKNGFIVDFQTFMTGEVFNILSEHSILKDSIIAGTLPGIAEPLNRYAFKLGVEVSAASNLLHSIFTVRTCQLFEKFSKGQNYYYLSGMLIGTELRQLLSKNTGELIICSGKNLYEHYKLAAETLGLNDNVKYIQPELIDKATIAGQIQIFKALNLFSYE